ncbi:MAG TPA: MOSC N-terminal beta barrel domain-containing protein [Trebonia sp.]|jgi:hypothetical protein
MNVTGLYRYPVKSCRGERLGAAEVEPWGLAGDRRWMLVDEDGTVVTAREYPSLVLVTPTADHGKKEIRFSTPGLPELAVSFPEADGNLVPVNVWNSHLVAALADAASAEWFTKITGRPTRLVYLDDPTRRLVNPEHSRGTDRVSFADGYPLLLTSEASLAQLNDWILEGPRSEEAPVAMTRFRPSAVIDGAAPWAEDSWHRIRIGDVSFRVAKACDRCVFTTIDPDTAEKGREPLVTLARHRRWDGKIWFGMNLIPDLAPGAPGTLRAGDRVEVLD